jgi:hypothetical protein
MDGKLQEGEDENRMTPTSAGDGSGDHDEDHPRGSERDVNFVAEGVMCVGTGDEVREIAAAWWTVQGPVVEGEAEQDGEDEIQSSEEVTCTMTGGEVGGAEAGEVAGEKVSPVVSVS